MSDPFKDIRWLLKEEKQGSGLPIATISDGIYLTEHRLMIHFVSVPFPQNDDIPPDYFQRMSEKATEQQIKIIHLWQDVYHQHKALVESRILSLIGKRTRIHARETTVIRLDKEVAWSFLSKHHLQQYTGAYYKYGLMHKGELVAVAIFSKSRVMTDGVVPYRSYELERFASKQGTTVTGGLGKLLNHFMIQHHPAHLMTYADRDWSAGAGYEKLGFTLAGFTDPQAFYVNPVELIRYPLNRLPENVSADEMEKKGYIKIYNAGNLKYVLDRRNKP